MNKRSYGESITVLGPNEVFVFGSNKNGFHGAGAAGYASFGRFGNHWREENYANKPNGWLGKWNIKGISNGFQIGTEGKSYALPTVNRAGDRQSLSKEEIISNISELYRFAIANPNLIFLVAGSSTIPRLNGYSHNEMVKMFVAAGEIPDNVIFSDSYTKMIEAINLV